MAKELPISTHMYTERLKDIQYRTHTQKGAGYARTNSMGSEEAGLALGARVQCGQQLQQSLSTGRDITVVRGVLTQLQDLPGIPFALNTQERERERERERQWTYCAPLRS